MKLKEHPLARAAGTIGLFMGGRSSERAISLRSGRAIFQALTSEGFNVVKIDPVNGFRKKIKQRGIDLAFLALHGAGGEDGSIQRILEGLGVPFTGSDSTSSALAFDKSESKKCFERFGIPTPRYDILTGRNWKQVLSQWTPPFVLKPVKEGSSIGVHMVEKQIEAARQIPSLLRKYGCVLIEERIYGREFSVPIFDGEPLPVIEIRPKRKFYDYRAKYTRGLTDYLVPAPISNQLTRKLQKTVEKAYVHMELRDIARGDLMVDSSEKVYLLEMNSIPGFTETSLVPKAAREIGVDFSDLCARLVEMAWERKNEMRERAPVAAN